MRTTYVELRKLFPFPQMGSCTSIKSNEVTLNETVCLQSFLQHEMTWLSQDLSSTPRRLQTLLQTIFPAEIVSFFLVSSDKTLQNLHILLSSPRTRDQYLLQVVDEGRG